MYEIIFKYIINCFILISDMLGIDFLGILLTYFRLLFFILLQLLLILLFLSIIFIKILLINMWIFLNRPPLGLVCYDSISLVLLLLFKLLFTWWIMVEFILELFSI